MASRSYTQTFLAETAGIAQELPGDEIEAMAAGLASVRERGGRLFILGVGGGAGHASHAVNDFRKICHLESYTPVDNVSELTARTNDEGWETTFAAWLRTSRLGDRDAVLVFSVGGGSREHNVSMNLVHAVELAKEVGAAVYGIVGKSDGTTAQLADVCVVVPSPAARRTPHVEAFQAVLWHLLVSHPALAAQAGKWESVERAASA
jgi:D-sedoheptulose 7-phosphate isomerase